MLLCTETRLYMQVHEEYDWTSLINSDARRSMTNDIDMLIRQGKFWHNSPPYQTNVNVFGLNTPEWNNLKMSFIWSCFAFMGREAQIKSIKSWGYQTNLATQENRDMYWHQHIRENNLVVSGVYYLQLPPDAPKDTSGTEFAPAGVEQAGHYYGPANQGAWVIFPGKTWHRPGILTSEENRYIVAADMEI